MILIQIYFKFFLDRLYVTIINYSKVPEKTYYEFYSNDNGKTWIQK